MPWNVRKDYRAYVAEEHRDAPDGPRLSDEDYVSGQGDRARYESVRPITHDKWDPVDDVLR
ncbi:MAG: hypothetical protein JWN49_518 [Parcubacteria group bacterium]|nr:hypothetical protein [Parcubacteria group bacterium]